ncbi:MAG: UDP-N-acetylmuramoyl-L-alanyl-D-glutamate-2,6-diaminopimelate ligase [Berkelbacteria bacterium GW2011_GWA2_35_9]|uniref:UDP-N-acetylmuramoyl-L-alanyl-D-glutamate-2, 6-diaminopimelate ligase n=1 Tax=Berkelbacteria bacterium GW2011_GWA2_35_9 TaxID=1618333 RepID=A0A0G0DJ61_9BACT|nr:MAG: UDP-N-acetylmuramoyl-L-alanyl-D-glutamate-2,6-diaminopimelate ligase [Berkelbacteria bacterium GW2011_GWA2_35_9]
MLRRIKNIYHLLRAVVANFRYAFPTRKLITIAVTGTNGKTSTVNFIGQMLDLLGESNAWVTTIDFKVANKTWQNKTKMTALDPMEFQKIARQAVKSGCKYFIFEATSHAIDQKRIWGTHINVAILTNVTRDHLDYHKTFKNYLKTKLKIFRRKTKAVINLDDENAKKFIKKSRKIITYSIKNPKADLNLKNCEIKNDQLLGEFNQSNLLASLGALISLGFDKKIVEKNIFKLKNIRGRMEMIECGQNFKVIIDYAHTPDAFKKLYSAVVPLKKNKIIHIFGATGARDKGKRPMLAKIASQFADKIILTNEDPYHEKPEQIIDEIATGIPKIFSDYEIIVDRKKAIEKAIQTAEKDDVVLITGKGHEEIMAVSDGTKKGFKLVEFGEREIVKNAIQKILNTKS